jgi:cob(I)alamin adenosyltransferase
MGKNRLTHIVTRTGDDGTTALADGTRVGKNHPRVEALGDVDELNSLVGLALCEALPGEIAAALRAIQHDLFDLGARLAAPGHGALENGALTRLDALAAAWNAGLPALAEFVLPGGSRGAALCHVARAVCRRAERHVAALGEAAPAGALPYLNRLADLLFITARRLNQTAGVAETLWRAEGRRPS